MTPSSAAEPISQILEVDEVAADDRFFDLGGNSVIVLTLIARDHQVSGATLSILDVVRAATLAQLSEVIIGRSPATLEAGTS